MTQPQQHKDQPSAQPPAESKAAAWLEWQRQYQSKASFQVWFIWHRYARSVDFDAWLAARARGEQ